MSDFYLRRAGREQAGPFTEDELRSMAQSGLIPHDAEIRSTLVQLWSPISSAPEIASLIDDLPSGTADSDPPPVRAYAAHERVHPPSTPSLRKPPPFDPNAPRPWVRFWARFFDDVLFSTVIAIVLLPLTLGSSSHSDDEFLFLWMIVGTAILRFVWVFVEAAFLSNFGATPGKMLLQTQVLMHDDQPIPSNTAMGRSFIVYAQGMALGIPFLALLANLLGYIQLTSKGSAPWDRECQTKVVHQKSAPERVFAFIVILVVTLIVNTLIYAATTD